jgi:hypothetical protein
MYKVSGVVEIPGPPLVSAMTESKTLSVPLMLKIKDDSRTGRERGRMTRRIRCQELAPSIRAASRTSSEQDAVKRDAAVHAAWSGRHP